MDEKEAAKEIKDRFSDFGVDIPQEDIEERLEKLTSKFKVPMNEARRSVTNYFLKEYNISRGEFYGSQTETPLVNVKDLVEDGKWVNVKVKVLQLWDNTHESISQVGIVGDSTGTIKFVKWANANLPDVEENKTYHFRNVVIDEWNEKFQINLNRTSSIEEIDEDIEIGTSSITASGAMVDIQSGSGLIKRCPECNRPLSKGACPEHGKVEGVYDLRIKAVLDDGESVHEALLNRELTEYIGEITLESAKSMASEALDPNVVLDYLKEKLMGKYYTVTGPKLDRYILVETIEQQSRFDENELDELIASAEVV